MDRHAPKPKMLAAPIFANSLYARNFFCAVEFAVRLASHTAHLKALNAVNLTQAAAIAETEQHPNLEAAGNCQQTPDLVWCAR